VAEPGHDRVSAEAARKFWARIWGIVAELAGCGLVVLAAPACEKARAPRQILAGANRWDGSPVLLVGAYLT